MLFCQVQDQLNFTYLNKSRVQTEDVLPHAVRVSPRQSCNILTGRWQYFYLIFLNFYTFSFIFLRHTRSLSLLKSHYLYTEPRLRDPRGVWERTMRLCPPLESSWKNCVLSQDASDSSSLPSSPFSRSLFPLQKLSYSIISFTYSAGLLPAGVGTRSLMECLVNTKDKDFWFSCLPTQAFGGQEPASHTHRFMCMCVYIYRFMDTCLFVSQHLTDVWAAWGLCNSLPLFDLSCGGKHLPPIFSHFSYTCWTLLLLSAVWLKSPLKKLFESTLGTLFRGE